jgi:transcriptional regulator with XRE-family HTH domain
MKQVNLVLIRSRRKEMKITLQEMADTLGFRNASNYYKYEKGEYKFDASHIPVVAKKLKLKMNEIFFDQNFAKTAN